jgi:hypothetical protein
LKLLILGWILQNTEEANSHDWASKAVDYRYLAERLRTMFYLPRIGSFQPPAAAMPQYVDRAVRQSAVDWLFDAIVRSISPAVLPFARKQDICGQDGRVLGQATVIDVDAMHLLVDLRDGWVNEQCVYHDRTARIMARMFDFFQKSGSLLSKVVIGLVCVDVVIGFIDWHDPLNAEWRHRGELTTLVLLFFATVLPAAVASLNAIRFQSECRRLAERSAVLRTILGGRYPREPVKGGRWGEAYWLGERIARAKDDPATDLGLWSRDVLRLTETIAGDFVHEVAEWSVLYAKELPEP